MLLRDLVLRRGCCWPSLLLHCALHPLWGFVQVSGGAGCAGCGVEDLLVKMGWLSLHSHNRAFLLSPL